MVYQGHVVGGVIVLDEPVHLPEGAAVQVALVQPAAEPKKPSTDGKSIEEKIAEIVAEVPAEEWARLPEDLTDNLDHYIYGTPKK